MPKPSILSKLKTTQLILLALICAMAVTAFFVAIRGLDPSKQNLAQNTNACPLAAEQSGASASFATGELAALSIADLPYKITDITFFDQESNQRTIQEWQGKIVLINLWATWCKPCREEMPALDRLQAAFPKEAFEVIAVSIDREGRGDPKAFLEEINTQNLSFYHDASGTIFKDLKKKSLALGMPTSILLNQEGCLIGHLAGPAHWDDKKAINLINTLISRKE